MISSTPRRARTPDHERSVYTTLFPTTPMPRTDRDTDEESVNEYTVNLIGLDHGSNQTLATKSAVRKAKSSKVSPVCREAHEKCCEALYSMGRNESFLIDPVPLVKQYLTLSEEAERELRDRGPEVRDLCDLFHKEKYTWRLIWALVLAARGGDTLTHRSSFYLPESDADEIDDLFDLSYDFRMAQTIVDWLEERYREENRLLGTASLCAFTDHEGMYAATQQLLAKNKCVPGMITELDPDAPLRQNKAPHDQDAEDEQRLYRSVFELVRGGQVSYGMKLAADYGHFMLAVGMNGWKAFEENSRDTENHPVCDDGNPYRDVWKLVVWKKLNDERVSVAEKAIYAALSGNLELLLPMCPQWEDQLWAHLKTLVDIAMELHLRDVRGTDLAPLPEDYPKESETLGEILSGLEARVELEGHDFFRQIQKFLMLQNVDGLIEFMYDFCVEIADVEKHNSLPGQQLRFMANLALFVKYYRQLHDSTEKIHLIVAFYVQRLIDEEVYDVVPKYVLHLPDVLRETCYLKLLTALRELSDRERLDIIEAAQKQDIDIFKYITKFVYDAIHCGDVDVDVDFDFKTKSPIRDEITEQDLVKNDALKWLFAQPGHSLLGMKYVNSALRNAIMRQKPSVARSIIALVPQDSVREMAEMAVQIDADSIESPIKDSAMSSGGHIQLEIRDDILEPSLQVADGHSEGTALDYKKCLKEYLCAQEYLEALQSFNQWFQHYHREKPQEVIATTGDAMSARSTLSTEFAKRALLAKMEAWKLTLGSLCDRASRHLYCILNYPDGGWMCDPHEEADDEADVDSNLDVGSRRRKQLKALRRICVPQVASLLQTVLHGSGRYADAMAIANLIAGEALCLYNEFSKEDLASLLAKIQESAVELLKIPGNMDPYGMGEI